MARKSIDGPKPRGRQLVKLKERKLAHGDISLFLEYYMGSTDGKAKRIYKPTGLVIGHEATKAEADMIWRQAEAMRQLEDDRQRDLRFGTSMEEARLEAIGVADDFVAIMERWIATHKSKEDYITRNAMSWFREFIDERSGTHVTSLNVRQLDTELMTDFLAWCHKRGHGVTGITVYGRFKTFINRLAADGTLSKNPCFGVKQTARQKTESRRQIALNEKKTLTLEEVGKLFAIEPPKGVNPDVPRAFKVCLLTGMRYSDVRDLTGDNVHREDGVLLWIQRKTGIETRQTLTPELLNLLGDTHSGKPIFNMPTYLVTITRHLQKWVKAAGIDKKITFHCARHTAGTLMVASGEPLLVVSKLLGHSSITMTQRYVRTAEEQKKAASMRLAAAIVESTQKQGSHGVE